MGRFSSRTGTVLILSRNTPCRQSPDRPDQMIRTCGLSQPQLSIYRAVYGKQRERNFVHVGLLGSCVICTCRFIPTWWTNVIPPSSGLKTEDLCSSGKFACFWNMLILFLFYLINLFFFTSNPPSFVSFILFTFLYL
jgi:hypothetical protein